MARAENNHENELPLSMTNNFKCSILQTCKTPDKNIVTSPLSQNSLYRQQNSLLTSSEQQTTRLSLLT